MTSTVTKPDDHRVRHQVAERPRRYDAAVATAAENLFEKALQLPASDRAHLAADLLASLDTGAADESSVDGSWSTETARRAQMLETGEAQLVTWDHLQERIAERRSSPSSG